MAAFKSIPCKPPRWLETACVEFANACRRNGAGFVELSTGGGFADVVNLDGTVYTCREGEWDKQVRVNG